MSPKGDIDWPEGPARPAQETVLVVDDSRAQRRLLTHFLTKMGLRVLEAPSGEAALAVCQFEQPDLIVSDWVMPGMDGLEFCREFRAMQGDRYGYFILQTSNDEKHEVAHGLDAGADDFLTKPVNAAELRARVRAGQRVLRMERELTEKNRQIGAALEELRHLHQGIDRDLQDAHRLQQSLVRERHRRFGPLDVSLLLQPAGRIGGDLVGMFEVNAREVGVFALDVSGHGIASALMTARLAGYLSGSEPETNIAIAETARGERTMRSPAEVAEQLNDLVLKRIETDQYLTLALARVELDSGTVTLTQAGHPHPMLQRATGTIEPLGTGGMPVGLLPGASFFDSVTVLRPGDRLFLVSDGITECMSPRGEMLDTAGLKRLMRLHADARGQAYFDRILAELADYSGEWEFSDDISAALLEFGR
ncbi:PP2C family protein-serine/threonine phosphatase [Pseudoruegeria sp. HB172150]|uniref:PP2C family protein-serine/threonine phosphatase n=1 Tax=Pseudoruegeria sp. HB172150 TaxID=2721164 RepID=UPI001C12E25D|nr:SpoIIE family protein phosphatase [Pseudoruegeria sp. HB172150]